MGGSVAGDLGRTTDVYLFCSVRAPSNTLCAPSSYSRWLSVPPFPSLPRGLTSFPPHDVVCFIVFLMV